MGFIKGTLFLTTGMFRPTSKRERYQRTVANEQRRQTLELMEQTQLMAQASQSMTSEKAAWAGSSAPDANTETQMSKLDKIAALSELHALGVLTDEEFAEQKTRALGGLAESAGG